MSMMWQTEEQRGRACRALLATLGLAHYWGDGRPSDDAVAVLEKRGPGLSHGERLLVLVAWDLWNSGGNTPLGELLDVLDPERTRALLGLISAANSENYGPAIDAWITALERRHGLGLRAIQ